MNEELNEELRSKHLAEKLVNLLEMKNISLRTLSTETGLGLSNLSKIKNNDFKTFPRFSTIQTLANYFDVPISALDIVYNVDYRHRDKISKKVLKVSDKYNQELLNCIETHYQKLYDYLILLSHKGYSIRISHASRNSAAYPNDPHNEFYERVKQCEKIELEYFKITLTTPDNKIKSTKLSRLYRIIQEADNYFDYILAKNIL